MMPSSQPEEGLGEVIRFPRRDDQTDDTVRAVAERIDPDDVDTNPTGGEVEGGAPGAEIAVRPDTLPAKRERGALVPAALAGPAKTMTKAIRPAGRKALTSGLYTLGGMHVVTSRAAARLMHHDITVAIRQARAAGDYGTVAELEQQKRASADARWNRVKMMFEITGKAAKATGCTLGVLTGLFLVATIGAATYAGAAEIGELFSQANAGGANWENTWTNGYWAAVTSGATGVAEVATGLWSWFWTLLPWAAGAGLLGGAYALHKTGREAQALPGWASKFQAPEPVDGEMVPDEGAILSALRNLGYAPLNKAIKEGWTPRWLVTPHRVGKGWHAQLLLPQQVPVTEIAARKDVLAHNLMRKPIEVWPTEPRDQASVLDLWVADPGVLTKPVDPWPLLEEGTADYFKGVPVAYDARGDLVTGRLMAANYLIAGIMGSGKSSLVIALLLGAMLDPLVDIDVYVMAYNVDYDAMRPRLRTLVKGDEDEHVEAAMEALRELVAEVSERGRILEELGGEESKNTRAIAERDPRMRPRVAVFDEVHELFTHKEYGPEACELALKVTKKARKTGITCLWVTPDADAKSLPRGISKTASNRVAFAINDHQGNDSILGTGMHKRGYSATTLVAGEDVGTAMAAGFGKTPGLIRACYIRKDKNVDEITPVVERAMALRETAGITSIGQAPVEQRDLLDDLGEVFGPEEDRVKDTDLVARLRQLAPSWQPYKKLTGKTLRDQLADTPAAAKRRDGYWFVWSQDVHAARAEQAVSDPD
ncbi:FtsK/SpoIIIE domain-containing protein [Saccharopolyspora sp. NPDC002686]|uniref:FtsK/SpoIIIE domain-containing protein n=1 Tax=Saccharopolyspora sp. NPDC002686 TaxID=3154541 RepID=UPI003322D266